MTGGCAGLLGIEDLAGEDDSVVDVAVLIDRIPVEGIDVIGHRIDGTVSDHQRTDASGVAAVEIPGGGLVSVLVEVSPTRYELRTWADLRDGDRLLVNAAVDDPSIDAAITLSDRNTGGLASWRVSFRSFSTTGSGGLGSPLDNLASIGVDNLSDNQTISAIARLRNGGSPRATARVIDAQVAGDSVQLEFSDWSRGSANDEIDVVADLGIDGQLVVGEVRDRQFFVGEDYALDRGAATTETVLVDREFADLIGVGVVGPGGAMIQTDFIDRDTRSFDAELVDLDELVDGRVDLRARTEVSWAVEPGGDVDTVLATLELRDASDRRLVWRVEADPRRALAALPAFPTELAIDPASFTDLDDGQVEVFASSAHDGYRALRDGGVELAGHMSSGDPILDIPGRVRSQSLELSAP